MLQKWKRPVAAVALGIVGFGINLLDINLFTGSPFKFSILPGLLFPLLVSLAWGWRMGLLSALAGGAQAMWILWWTDGYGVFYSVPIFTLWIVWHGIWADVRKNRADTPWYLHRYAVELPFRVVSELGFFTVFRWLVSLNPPPWAPGITWDQVSTQWLTAITLKHVALGYLLLMVAHVLTRFSGIRRFFELQSREEETLAAGVLSTSAAAGLLYWIVDSFLVYYLDSSNQAGILELLVLEVPAAHAVARLVVLVISFAIGLVVLTIYREREQQRTRADYFNRLLAGIRNVNQLITRESDPDVLLNGGCRLMVREGGYAFMWVSVFQHELYPSGAFAFSSDNDHEQIALGIRHAIEGGTFPHCVEEARTRGELVVTVPPVPECSDCPAFGAYETVGSMTAPLFEADGRVFGVVTAAAPLTYVRDVQEHELFQEIVGDLAYALHNLAEHRKRVEYEHTLQRSIQEKTALLQEVHHRVKNNLNVVTSLLSLQCESVDADERFRNAMENCRNRIYSISLVHEQLYQGSDLSRLNMHSYVQGLLSGLQTTLLQSKRISVASEVDSLELEIGTAVPLGIIINELVTNAYKHAFANRQSGTITIALQRITSTTAELVVEDDGVGMATAETIPGGAESVGLSLGLQLVGVLTDQLQGQLTVENRTETPSNSGDRMPERNVVGTRVGIRFPLVQERIGAPTGENNPCEADEAPGPTDNPCEADEAPAGGNSI